jgi:hypothetical protein
VAGAVGVARLANRAFQGNSHGFCGTSGATMTGLDHHLTSNRSSREMGSFGSGL